MIGGHLARRAAVSPHDRGAGLDLVSLLGGAARGEEVAVLLGLFVDDGGQLHRIVPARRCRAVQPFERHPHGGLEARVAHGDERTAGVLRGAEAHDAPRLVEQEALAERMAIVRERGAIERLELAVAAFRRERQPRRVEATEPLGGHGHANRRAARNDLGAARRHWHAAGQAELGAVGKRMLVLRGEHR
jgi:hypothetical protein